MKISFQLQATFLLTPTELYNAWLDPETHTAMTGGEARCSNREGSEFTAWDGYISGKNIKLIPAKEIHQSWRTSQFNNTDEDSLLVITFRETRSGCEITLTHSNIPEGQPDYEQGWALYKPHESLF